MANTHSLDLELDSSQYAYITDGDQTGLNFTGNFSIECWVKFESLPASGGAFTFTRQWTASGNQRAYWVRLLNNSGTLQLQMQISADGTTTDVTISVVNWTPSTGVWYHFAGTHSSGGDVKFYINGSQQGTTQTGAKNPFDAVGTYRFGGDAADGKIDEVRAWNDVRTSTEIANNRLVELVGNEANLVGYWKLNNNYLDETSNSNDLTAVGSPVFSTDVPFGASKTTGNVMFFSAGGVTVG
jgi:hypothetical protein